MNTADRPPAFKALRLNDARPLVLREMFQALQADPREGRNINGPSLIRLPDWLPAQSRADPGAVYYLYFAHHGGRYIRLAWAERIEGPWHLYRVGKHVDPGRRGVLDLHGRTRIGPGDDLDKLFHIASPEVLVDERRQRFILYFHCPVAVDRQCTFVALSDDGLDFSSDMHSVILGQGYFRTFDVADRGHAVANGGWLFRARPGVSRFDDAAWTPPPGHDPLADLWERRDLLELVDKPEQLGLMSDTARPRHFGVRLSDRTLSLFYTVKNDPANPPERIFAATFDVSEPDWHRWRLIAPATEVLAPEVSWEGIEHPIEPSSGGGGTGKRQLRDPCIYEEAGRVYMLYTGAGEEAIGLAELVPPT